MWPAEDLSVYMYVLVHDAIMADALVTPPRSGPVPTRSDAELLAIALVRHLLGRGSESAFLVGRVLAGSRPHPDPAEVADVRWPPPDRLRADLADNLDRYAPRLGGALRSSAPRSAGRRRRAGRPDIR